MSRDIKFRAWHDTEGMTTPYAFLNESNGFTTQMISTPKVVMQYTGLKDVNGVEIYEGDVLKSDHIAKELYDIGSYYYGVVNYCVYKSMFVVYFGDVAEPLHYHKNEQVIGNIHQNPELLEQAGQTDTLEPIPDKD